MNLGTLLAGLLLGNAIVHIDMHGTHQMVPEIEEKWLKTVKWEQYKTEFGKVYESDYEELRRMEIFEQNSKIINEHNELYATGRYTYELGHNQFSDITHEEYLERYIQQNSDEESESVENGSDEWTESTEDGLEDAKSFAKGRLPKKVDWRKKAVIRVKDEKNCGASWAFSAIGALEGQVALKTHRLRALSEQNLIDCSTAYGNRGCSSGNTTKAYIYIARNGGVNSNYTYPWRGNDSTTCHYIKLHTNPKIRGFVTLQSGNETNLKAAVARVGPVAVSVDASSVKFKHYRKGLFNEPHCSATSLNRGVLVVGYSPKAWVIKNSWGVKWGSKGYIYMSKDKKNQCGIASRALYPVLVRRVSGDVDY